MEAVLDSELCKKINELVKENENIVVKELSNDKIVLKDHKRKIFFQLEADNYRDIKLKLSSDGKVTFKTKMYFLYNVVNAEAFLKYLKYNLEEFLDTMAKICDEFIERGGE